MLSLVEIVAAICLVWVSSVVVVQGIGVAAIFRYFSKPGRPSVSATLGKNAPSVTIIRPVKGLEPLLYECIASTFRQTYPADKISIRLCVEDETDPAYPVLQQLVHDFPNHDAQILIETSDPFLYGSEGRADNVGPNPKIRNLSRAYREAKGDLVWIIDCNVWVAKGVLGRMVDKLMGFAPAGQTAEPYKFVHQMPIVVDVAEYGSPGVEDSQVKSSPASEAQAIPGAAEDLSDDSLLTKIVRQGGGRLDEMFFATSHAKFYGAINTVGVAPCIVGKSNMFRKAHLDQATSPLTNPILLKTDNKGMGVDYFSYCICEDHLIGDLLWRTNIPGHRNHGMAQDLVLQPLKSMSITSYAARRCRWLRARKYTVLVATLLEPGVESLVCCAYFAFALTTLSWFHEKLGIPQTWSSMGFIWLVAVASWMFLDWQTFQHLHSGESIEPDSDSPRFARGTCRPDGMPKRVFWEWCLAWVGREVMALPVWTRAVWCGATVRWRGKTFRVYADSSVEGLDDGRTARKSLGAPQAERARQSSKDRLD
ncbi:hypothetical protein E4U42_003097 [Claviceps africana]|uniref:Ceramide glucosyltransferase n=1 Tax=Claviceps africana TaxID=83212 RepID=A0A8K0JF02_9HYPO|nr:hypothetical protein E4U42_003097 [Claviceps africana]